MRMSGVGSLLFGVGNKCRATRNMSDERSFSRDFGRVLMRDTAGGEYRPFGRAPDNGLHFQASQWIDAWN